MFKPFFKIALTISVIILFSGCNKKKNDILYDRKYLKEIKELRNEAISYMMINNIPGATFAVAKDGKIIYSEGMGLASKDLEVVATRNTKFRIGVVSECFTSVLFKQMVADATLHPDSTVQHYIPDFKNLQNPLPIKELVSHTSGLRQPNEQESNWRGLNVAITDGVDQFKNDSLAFPPGYYQDQNMFNYNLLGAIMEKASGKTFPQLLKEYITDTLKLENTVQDNPLAVIKGRSDFYDLNIVANLFNATTYDLRYRAPSEGLLSNAEDLVKFGNAVLESKIITDEQKNDLLEPVKLIDNTNSAISKGWLRATENNGRIFYGRSGGVIGGGAALIIYPEEKLVVAATVNVTDKQGQIPVVLFANKFLKPLETKQDEEKKEPEK